jgi:SpoU rRNA methylase family enzyme
VFRNRNNELDEDVILTAELRDKLDLLNDKITLLIDNKYGKDTSRAIKFRRDIRTAIDKQTKKVRTDLRKRQLKYLKSLI